MSVLNNLYRERAHLVAMLAGFCPSRIVPDNGPDGEEWSCVYIDLPTGQASWHIAPDDLHLFKHVPVVEKFQWDGHSTEEKYRRVDEATKLYAWRKDQIGEYGENL